MFLFEKVTKLELPHRLRTNVKWAEKAAASSAAQWFVAMTAGLARLCRPMFGTCSAAKGREAVEKLESCQDQQQKARKKVKWRRATMTAAKIVNSILGWVQFAAVQSERHCPKVFGVQCVAKWSHFLFKTYKN